MEYRKFAVLRKALGRVRSNVWVTSFVTESLVLPICMFFCLCSSDSVSLNDDSVISYNFHRILNTLLPEIDRFAHPLDSPMYELEVHNGERFRIRCV